VVIGPGTADPFSPKAVRASMGAIFAVPVVRAAAGPSLPGVKIALHPAGRASLAQTLASLREPHRPEAHGVPAITLMIGAEREGLPDEVLDGADHTAAIQIETHSLNAAMAATVALYEATRMAPS
jgi:TrmH family RNA methyltransferase